jgi:hypothetical protein
VDAVSRRALLERAGLLAGATSLASLTDALRGLGWLEAAEAATPRTVRDAMGGLVAFVVPGRDTYSRAQGVTTAQPGGVEAGAVPELIETLDLFLPGSVPLSATVAALLDQTALAVAPRSARGRFRSPFANLGFRQKGEVFRRLEAIGSPEAGSIRFLFGNLPGLVAFLSYSDAAATRRRRLGRRPVGWQLSRYDGVAEGRAELRGYFQGRRKTQP